MALVSVETKFGALTAAATYPAGYDSTKLNLGPGMYQYVEGGNEGSYVGPVPVSVLRPMESTIAKPVIFPKVVNWSTNIDWVFFADGTAAGVSPRLISMYTFNKATHAWTAQGYISCAIPSAATNYTNVGIEVTYDKYLVGTAACAGGTTAVTGAGTIAPTWQASRLAVGSRIAFGTTDPTTNPTWYEISAIGSDTTITLTTNGPNTGGQGSYVIEELRVVMAFTNSTPASGGVYIVKGLRPEAFTAGGTAIPAATTVDNIRAVYWIADAATILNVTIKGICAEPRVDWNTHYLWSLEGVATPNALLYKYNLRAALTLTAGKDGTPFNSFVLKTGASGAYVGTISAINNMKFVTMASGPGSGLGCLYFTTTTRIYRTAATSTILSTSTTWLSGSDSMTEVPPGGTAIGFAVTGAMNTFDYHAAIDKLVIMSTGATATKSYVTGYNAIGSQIDRIFLDDFRQTPQVSSDAAGLAPIPNTLSISGASIDCGGKSLMYMCVPGTTALTNFVYVFPVGADWEYTALSNNVVITPSIPTPNCSSFNRVLCSDIGVIGGRTGMNLGAVTEPYRLWYRTTGITDNTGAWNAVDYSGNISGASAAAAIQFKIEFRTIGHTNLPARLINLTVNYNDTSTDVHFQASIGLSSISASQFAWRFSQAFGSTVPTLYVRLYDATNPATNYVTDNSAAPTGTWDVSTNGGSSWISWASWASADKANETTYIRYTPASLGSGIKVRAVLSLA